MTVTTNDRHAWIQYQQERWYGMFTDGYVGEGVHVSDILENCGDDSDECLEHYSSPKDIREEYLQNKKDRACVKRYRNMVKRRLGAKIVDDDTYTRSLREFFGNKWVKVQIKVVGDKLKLVPDKEGFDKEIAHAEKWYNDAYTTKWYGEND